MKHHDAESPVVPPELGVNQAVDRIHGRLRRYLEAQYHIRDEGLIEERQRLLDEAGAISQQPFIEVTPSYAVDKSYAGLKVPDEVRELLGKLMDWKPGIGVFPPYVHQSEALNAFFSKGGDGDDLVIATGTGSGKTETFLYAVLGMLAREATTRPASFSMPGIRALLLYPMNALVSDQTARLRKMLGSERLASEFRSRWGRHPVFGMYTSRTPYPGIRNGTKDQRHVAPILEYYEDLELATDPTKQRLVEELRSRGRWPAKDIPAFFGRSQEEQRTWRSGKREGDEYTRRHWDQRLHTQPADRELLTRNEMQLCAPDLFVTNYSMLEYTLLRPLERSIYAQTRDWLHSDARNQLVLILDEAHMYRGVGGAEVGLLIRRLQSRLGITRDRLRCILTSASLGGTPAARDAAEVFARGLCGQAEGKGFTVIGGTAEPRSGAAPGTQAELNALARVSAVPLAAAKGNLEPAHQVVTRLAADLGWPAPPSLAEGELALRQYACRHLTGFGPLERLIRHCSANGTAFAELTAILFPDSDTALAERATDGLLALGCFARRLEPGREAAGIKVVVA